MKNVGRLRIGLCLAAGLALFAWSAVAGAVEITVDCAKKHQVIDGLGNNVINWDNGVYPYYAKPEFQKMEAEDLGASVIRFDFLPDTQKTPDLDAETLDPAKFNVKANAPATDFAVAVYKRNPKEVKIIASIFSPPAWMKDNNSVNNGGHLRADRLDHFGKYICGFCREFEKTYGAPLYALSLQNELLFKEPYASCQYTPAQFRDALQAIGRAKKKWPITTKIFGPEDMGMSPDRFMGFVNAAMKDPEAAAVLDIFACHGYANDGVTSDTGKPEQAFKLRDALKPFKRPLWMTETFGEGADHKGALEVAWKIQNNLVNGDMTAWVYLNIAMTSKNRASEALLDREQPMPKFYAAKHFFRFIRPGAQRVDAQSSSNQVSASAFYHAERKALTIELINLGDADASLDLAVANAPIAVKELEVYRTTSSGEKCAAAAKLAVAGGKAAVTIPAKSIMTLVTGDLSIPFGGPAAPPAGGPAK